jgi:hypothetical protein
MTSFISIDSSRRSFLWHCILMITGKIVMILLHIIRFIKFSFFQTCLKFRMRYSNFIQCLINLWSFFTYVSNIRSISDLPFFQFIWESLSMSFAWWVSTSISYRTITLFGLLVDSDKILIKAFWVKHALFISIFRWLDSLSRLLLCKSFFL